MMTKKLPLSIPFNLVLLLFLSSTAVVLCCWAIFGSYIASDPMNAPLLEPQPPPLWNTTLLRLALVDSGTIEVRKDIDYLLDGVRSNSANEPLDLSVFPNRGRTRTWTRLFSPRYSWIVPKFCHALAHWSSKRRYNPGTMPDLLRHVKYQIDGKSKNRYNSCAVVGNSGIILHHDHGALIDSHDFVIRLNNARTKGYRLHVGAKTSLAFVNSHILHRCARREGCFCHPYGEEVPMIMYICVPWHFVDYVVCNSTHKAPLLVTDPRFDLLCSRIVKYYSLKRFVEETGMAEEEWGRVHDAKMFHYSSGMQAVMLALGVCGRVSVFGFGKSAAAKHHYHDNQKRELGLHDYEAEYALYKDLAERPKAVPFLDDLQGFEVPPLVIYRCTAADAMAMAGQNSFQIRKCNRPARIDGTYSSLVR